MNHKLLKPLSFLWPVSLVRTVSRDTGKELVLVYDRGRLKLQTDDAVYSFDDKYHVFARALAEIAGARRGEKVLILGFGLGSIVYILEKNYGLTKQITGVESDGTIIALAQKYSLPRFRSSVGILHTDAATFIKKNTQTYDLVCADIFVGSRVPAFAQQLSFLQDTRRALAPGGRLLFNYMKDRPDEFASFRARFLEVFPGGRIYDFDTNFILYAEVM